MPAQSTHQTRSYVYALLTGIAGAILLVQLFARYEASIDLFTLLLFTIIALVVSYFRVPICQTGNESPPGHSPGLQSLWNVELALDGAIVLGAALVGGLAFGGWTAFIVGLVTPIMPTFGLKLYPRFVGRLAAGGGARSAVYGPERTIPWVDSAAIALLSSGRNVIALTLSWLAYQGMGGTLAPVITDALLALAAIILCGVYTLVRALWVCPALALDGEPVRPLLEKLLAPGRLLVETLPLLTSLLVSATFVRLGWSSFLTLALVFIGLSAVMWQMTETNRVLRTRIYQLEFAGHVRQAIEDTPREIDALCALAYTLCNEVLPSLKFEIGLYNSARTQVHIRFSTDGKARLPPMSLPLALHWHWASECPELTAVQTPAQLADLPFELSPLRTEQMPGSVLAVPLYTHRRDRTDLVLPDAPSLRESASAAAASEADAPHGAMILMSSVPNAFGEPDIARLSAIGELVGPAIGSVQRTQATPAPKQ